MVVLDALAVCGRLEVVYKEDLLCKIKVAVARSFPDQESLRWGDCNIVHKQMDDFHLNKKADRLFSLLCCLNRTFLLSEVMTNPC